MIRRTTTLSIVIFLFYATGYSYAQFLNFDHGSLTRQYLYHSPPNLAENAPLVVVMHGFTGNAMGVLKVSKMNAVADAHGFAVCYPQGTKDLKGKTFWNVGYDFHKGVTIDDVGFIVQLVKHLQKEHNLSPKNTFATGMSNGGEMCYLLACEASDIFTAVAPVAGMMLQNIFDNCSPTRPIPIFEIHGTKDKVNRFTGDIHGHDGWGAYPDIPFTIDYWAKRNKCTVAKTQILPDINTKDGSHVISEKHLNGIHGNQVWLYKIINGGHDWPGDSGNQDIETSREIWSFFSQFITK
jgi:polyhydroxybutyrate depolymerase